MKAFDIDWFEEIIITITRNKTRSLLTAFGVFWGIFMLVAMIGGGRGLQDLMSRNFDGFATNSCFMFTQNTTRAWKGFKKGRKWNLENDDITHLRSMVPGIAHITPAILENNVSVVKGDKKSTFNLKGIYPEYVYIEQQKMSSGRTINNEDIVSGRKVCTIGSRVYHDMFKNGENAIGQYIRVKGVYYQVVGVTGGHSNINLGGRAEEAIVIPFTILQQLTGRGKNVDIICITAKNGLLVTSLHDQIDKIVKSSHMIAPTDDQALSFINMEQMFLMMDSLFSGIRSLVWLVGLGTLLAGAIGVSNIMMVTVKERTSEIGIRRAIGAKPNEIMIQIIAESMCLTLLAGLAGISFGVLILQLFEVGITASGTIAHFQVSFSMGIAMLFVLLTLGIAAGLAPAYRAMAIKPIDAIREE
jgi:putative ABC transport system permease protein